MEWTQWIVLIPLKHKIFKKGIRFVPNPSFLYTPRPFQKKRYFLAVEKGCIGNEWVNLATYSQLFIYSPFLAFPPLVFCARFWIQLLTSVTWFYLAKHASFTIYISKNLPHNTSLEITINILQRCIWNLHKHLAWNISAKIVNDI